MSILIVILLINYLIILILILILIFIAPIQNKLPTHTLLLCVSLVGFSGTVSFFLYSQTCLTGPRESTRAMDPLLIHLPQTTQYMERQNDYNILDSKWLPTPYA